ncbi:MAG: UDP-N-acetylmuramoyl-L-alanyl-D-glutamate--2,6-diaminopimelate ligase [Lachnospirales bacterium]
MVFKDLVNCISNYSNLFIGEEVENVDVTGIYIDSRKCDLNSMFVAYKGAVVDSHDFVLEAYKRGARFFVLNFVPYGLESMEDISYIVVKDSRESLALCSKVFYKYNDDVNLIGVTGTNGKTSTTHYIHKILNDCGIYAGSIGTLGVYCKDEKIDKSITASTTPEYVELIDILDYCKSKNVNNCVMEVTSHALYYKKVFNLKFKVGVFTNLTQDHLDFHKTMDNYFDEKCKLFKMCDVAFINIDDSWGEKLVGISPAKNYTYSIEDDKECDFKAKDITVTDKYVEFTVNLNGVDEKFKLNVPGKFTVYNALSAVLVANISYGISANKIRRVFESMAGVPGRMYTVPSEKDFTVVVDYAHTPDALEKVIQSAKEVTSGRVVTIFGCGGDRDRTKRPIMCEIATRLSDFTIITSDNPRTEEPMNIINDVTKGVVSGSSYVEIIDREEAIKYAIENAVKNDFIIIAGKGHEDYQIIGTEKIHFDDVEIAKKYLGTK